MRTMNRVAVLAATLVLLAGLAGLVRGALPQHPAQSAAASQQGPGIVVGGAYVRQPANGVSAAAYLTIYNTTGAPDQLTGVSSGAGAQTTVHGADMRPLSTPTVPAHGSLALTPGSGHVMIEQLYGPLLAGQTVNLQLTFAHAGEVLVTAPVIGVAAPAPSGTGGSK